MQATGANEGCHQHYLFRDSFGANGLDDEHNIVNRRRTDNEYTGTYRENLKPSQAATRRVDPGSARGGMMGRQRRYAPIGLTRLEQVDAMVWNDCPQWSGIGGRHRVD